MKLFGYVIICDVSYRVPNVLVVEPGSVPLEGSTEYLRISSSKSNDVLIEESTLLHVDPFPSSIKILQSSNLGIGEDIAT
jgi:hypothetical protein